MKQTLIISTIIVVPFGSTAITCVMKVEGTERQYGNHTSTESMNVLSDRGLLVKS